MLDFIRESELDENHAPRVLFLSDAFGVEREWDGISLCLGQRARIGRFSRTRDWLNAVHAATDGAHLVARGTRAYDALRVAVELPEMVRSVTLIDPDLIAALPELSTCIQFREHAEMLSRTNVFAEQGSHRAAALCAIDWWMGEGSWSRTSMRLRDRFARGVPALLKDWRNQSEAPLDLLDLGEIDAPVRIVTGKKAPADIVSMARLIRIVGRDTSLQVVDGAGAIAHLTAPHIVGPEIRNFVETAEADWQAHAILARAA